MKEKTIGLERGVRKSNRIAPVSAGISPKTDICSNGGRGDGGGGRRHRCIWGMMAMVVLLFFSIVDYDFLYPLKYTIFGIFMNEILLLLLQPVPFTETI